MKDFIQLFAGSASQDLAIKIATICGHSLGNLQLQRFSDGELYPIIGSAIQNRHVCLIQATYPPADHLMELLLTIDAAKRAGAQCITVLIPYLGYSRQDCVYHSGGSYGAKLQANLLAAAGADRLITCDLHAQQIVGFFDLSVTHLASTAVFIAYIHGLQLSNLTFATPDLGGIARAKRYAHHFHAPLVVCDKDRASANEVSAVHVHGTVQDKNVIIIDDIVDTGSTICKAAEQLKVQGALTVRALCTHPVLSGNAYKRLEASVLEEVLVTDTIPLQQSSNKIKVCTIAPLFAEAVQHLG
jgi:ribose-phosphate pyrophosphokinase